MIHLRALGSLDLRAADGRELRHIVVQPKRLALLVYLVLAAPRGYHRRDKLLALFWPELDESHARGALSQSLHVLRKGVEADVVVRRGDEEVGLREGAVESDVAAFERAIADNMLAQALDLYRGSLLDGFFLHDAAPEFEHWLDGERARLKERALRAASDLASNEQDRGNLPLALHWIGRALDLAPYDEAMLRRKLLILDQEGNHAGALLAYRDFVRRLDEDVGLDPSPELEAVGKAIRFRSGDTRQASPSPRTDQHAATDSGEILPVQGEYPPVHSPHRTARILATVAVCVVAAVGLTMGVLQGGGAAGIPLERSIAVLPFENLSAEQENDFLAGGIHGAVVTQLTKISDLSVVSSQSVRSYARTNKSARQIGQELGVGSIIQASLQRAGGRVRVTAQLVDTRSDKLRWAEHYERDDTSLFHLQSEIALDIAEALQAKITRAERDLLVLSPTNHPQAYNYFLQGMEYQQRVPGPARGGSILGGHEIRAAESLYRRALDLDPNFALARAYLAQVHGELAFFGYDRSPARLERLRADAEAAVRLQPNLPEAHVAMGYYWYIGARDFPQALAEFEIASDGLPNDGHVQMMIANVHRRQGRWKDALAGYERALRLDPRHSDKALNLARTYLALGRYQDAARTWDHAIGIDPDNYQYLLAKARVFVHWQGITDSLDAALRRIPADYDPDGSTTLARIDLARLRRRPADVIAALAAAGAEIHESENYLRASGLRAHGARAFEALGDTVRARAEWATVRATLEIARESHLHDPHVLADLGVAYAALGLKQDAVRHIRQAIKAVPLSEDAWSAPLYLEHAAEILARVDEPEAAVEMLEQLLSIPNEVVSINALRLDPAWDPLRKVPRFQRLLEKNQ